VNRVQIPAEAFDLIDIRELVFQRQRGERLLGGGFFEEIL
jgi:hypothetical protein